jgi:hypothetical protein
MQHTTTPAIRIVQRKGRTLAQYRAHSLPGRWLVMPMDEAKRILAASAAQPTTC